MTTIIFSQEEDDNQNSELLVDIVEENDNAKYDIIVNDITRLMLLYANQDDSTNIAEVDRIRLSLDSLQGKLKNDYQYHWSYAQIYKIQGENKKARRHRDDLNKITSKILDKGETIPGSFLEPIDGIDKEPGRISKFINKLREDNTDLTYSPGAVMDKIVIDADHISNLPVSSVADILEYVMGINVYKRGVLDGNSSLSMMGGSSAQTLILLDGFNIFPGYTHYHDLDFPFSIYDIDKMS